MSPGRRRFTASAECSPPSNITIVWLFSAAFRARSSVRSSAKIPTASLFPAAAMVGRIEHLPVAEQDVVYLLRARRDGQQRQERYAAPHGITSYWPAALQTGNARPSRS